jgi:hypothetical protein
MEDDEPSSPQGGGPIAEATTNPDGIFRINNVLANTYTICARRVGFLPVRRSDLNVDIGEALIIDSDLMMTPGKGSVVAKIGLNDLDLENEEAQRVLREINVTLSPIGEGVGNTNIGALNALGEVTFNQIPLGPWRLRVAHPIY